MTISLSENNPRISYTVGQGVTQTTFTVPFEFFDLADLNVYVDGTQKTATTHYTVASGGSGATGTINLSVTGASGGSTVVITRDIDLARTTDFPTSGSFNIGSLNTELDKITAQFADRKDAVDRSLRLQDSDAAASMELPLKDARKGTVLGFNASTGVPEAGPTIADVSTLSAITADIAALADIEDGTTATDAISGVAAIASNVTTVAGIASNVTTVAGNTSNINSAVSNASNINTVAGSISNVNNVGNIASNVSTVAGISSNVTAVAGDASDIGTVASNISSVNTNATNISAIQGAAANASTATTKASEASASASTASTQASNSATSASTSTAQATNSANSATASANSATASANSATAAASSATAASNSQTAAASSAAAAATALDSFDDRYLGVKSSNPTQDNDGNALVSGALYFSDSANEMRVYDGANWIAATSAGNVSLILYEYTATNGQTTFSGSDDNSASLSYTVDNLQVVMNGVILDPSDFTATSGTSVVLAAGAAANDLVNIYAFKSFTTADMVSKTNGGTFAGNVGMGGTLTVTGNADLNGNLDVDGTTNLDAVDIDGAVDINGVVHVSPNTAGKDTFELSTNSVDEGRLRIKNVDTTTVQIRAGGDSYFNGGNLLVGTTVSDIIGNGGDGFTYRPNAGVSVSRNTSGGTVIQTNRTANDGTHILCYRSASAGSPVPVGQITNHSADFHIENASGGGTDAGIALQNNDRVNPLRNGALSDGTVDLGFSNYRWRNLYLSGGINFSANANASGMTSELLDDYEEGTWLPFLGSNETFTERFGEYTKVGNVVHAQFRISINQINNGSTHVIYGLPYAAASNGRPMGGSVSYSSTSATNNYWVGFYVNSGQSYMTVVGKTTLGASVYNGMPFFGNGADLIGAISYVVS